MEHDVASALMWLSSHDSVERTMRISARDCLLGATTSTTEGIAEAGGRVAVNLRAHEIIDDESLERVVTGNVSVRRGVARGLAEALRLSDPPDWMLDLAVRLADDADDATSKAILNAFDDPAVAPLVERPGFVRRITSTAGARRNLRPLLEACDRRDRLLPIAREILELATAEDTAPVDHRDYWNQLGQRRRLSGLVARLVEEAEREGNLSVRASALDAWDRLLEAEVHEAAQAFDERITDG